MPCNSTCAVGQLSQLSKNALTNLQAVVNKSIASLQQQQIVKQQLVSSISYTLAPLQAKQATLSNNVTNSRSAASVLPTSLIAQCSDLGILSSAIEAGISPSVESSNDILFKISHLQAVQQAVDADITTISNQISFLQNMLICIPEAQALSTTTG